MLKHTKTTHFRNISVNSTNSVFCLHFCVLVQKKLKTTKITRFPNFYFSFSILACFINFIVIKHNNVK
ncbi:hypothetical protein E2C01_039483 [Portunus trituberculatus]|uniref:Uncharacterized protein n=1 Tax=Portunus trituberculatus TaxID=210409 RepID=A0A5B7FLH2_PORTR|nr:hypothetical protein [Portunus trituberculatus]